MDLERECALFSGQWRGKEVQPTPHPSRIERKRDACGGGAGRRERASERESERARAREGSSVLAPIHPLPHNPATPFCWDRIEKTEEEADDEVTPNPLHFSTPFFCALLCSMQLSFSWGNPHPARVLFQDRIQNTEEGDEPAGLYFTLLSPTIRFSSLLHSALLYSPWLSYPDPPHHFRIGY